MKMYDVNKREGWFFALNANGDPEWRKSEEFALGAPIGFYSCLVNGKPTALIGTAPPAGVTNPTYAWHPGVPLSAGSASPSAPPPSPNPNASWEASQNRVFSEVPTAGVVNLAAVPNHRTKPSNGSKAATALSLADASWEASIVRVCGQLRSKSDHDL
jgi:hypothetical protein